MENLSIESLTLENVGWGGVLLYLLGVNLATFALYGYDKFAAKANYRRIPERVLHRLTFAGGTPAAIAGQKLFRHKTIKPEFQTTFRLIVATQAALLLGAGWFFFR
ncbi:MAG: DUF1294 domain-containing protein [Planctomycetota bacterium]